MTEEIPGAVFYTCDDSEEELVHHHPDDAIEAHLDGGDELPDEIELYGHAPLAPPVESLAARVLDRLLEELDDDFGDPADTPSRQTAPRVEAARAFVTTIVEGYRVWMCHRVGSRKVAVADWVARHRPDWRPAGTDA